MSICKHCHKEFDISDKPKGWMANHSRWCELNPKRKNYGKESVAAMNSARIKNGNLNQYVKAKNLGYTFTVSDETKQKLSIASKGRIKPKEECIKISNARKKWILENPEKHPWKRNDKFKSKPCEHLKEILIDLGISFIEEYQPIKDRGFSIDIAIPDKMIAIEVNGNQHYSDPKLGILNNYYKERHDLISNAGWKIHEIHYANVYNETFVEKLIALIV